MTKPGPRNVAFSQPVQLPGHELHLIRSMQSGHMSGGGPFTKECERQLKALLGAETRVVSSATHALEMMALLGEIGPGDEVICPSFTFVSTANAFALRGAELRFADNDDCGNILPSEVERLLTPRTKAVVAVHYAGASADLDRLLEICRHARIPLFEDAAQAIAGRYKGRPLGAIGALGALSFHETKNVGCGEGGALIFGDAAHLERAEILREKGTNRARFFEGLVDKYTWVDLGSSYLCSDLSCAYLLPQLESLDLIQRRRRQICERYRDELTPSLDRADIQILACPAYNTPNHHIFALILRDDSLRADFIKHMRAQSIAAPFHYLALHRSPFGGRYGRKGDPELPGCDKLAARLVRLPLFYNLEDDEQGRVIDEVKRWLAKS